MTAVSTRFRLNDVVKFINQADSGDPDNGVHVVITAINPAPLLFGNREHYRVFVPSHKSETYALSTELKEKR